MKTLFVFIVLLIPAFLVKSIDDREEKPIDAKNVPARIVPGLKQTYNRIDWDESKSLQNVQYMEEEPGEVLVPWITENHRFMRRASTCILPKNVTTSKLDCNIFDRMVRCNQTCIFGYTFREGIRRTMKCEFNLDLWSPIPEFEECKPFVDCTLSLEPGGQYKCYSNYIHKGPVCEISCSHYEDKGPVPKSLYRCDIEGNWTPKLPHCAIPGTGMDLVPVPEGPKTAAEI